MKIGDRIFVRGYIDEIRKDTVIVRNDGGYFGTVPSEVITGELPSAQPEKRTQERMETHACDLIDREAAVDAIYHHLPSVSRTRARTMLHEVPSAQPERKTGRWIDETFKPWGLVHHPYKCNQCGEHSEMDSDFCPNCGADMRQREEQE